jgi:hypothetical protein
MAGLGLGLGLGLAGLGLGLGSTPNSGLGNNTRASHPGMQHLGVRSGACHLYHLLSLSTVFLVPMLVAALSSPDPKPN